MLRVSQTLLENYLLTFYLSLFTTTFAFQIVFTISDATFASDMTFTLYFRPRC